MCVVAGGINFLLEHLGENKMTLFKADFINVVLLDKSIGTKHLRILTDMLHKSDFEDVDYFLVFKSPDLISLC